MRAAFPGAVDQALYVDRIQQAVGVVEVFGENLHAAQGDVVSEVGFLADEADSVFALLLDVTDGRVIIAKRGGQNFRVLDDLDAEEDVVRRKRLAVGEMDVVAQVEGVGELVFGCRGRSFCNQTSEFIG